MLRISVVFLLTFTYNIAFTQDFSYSLKSDLFRTVFRTNESEIINRKGTANYSTCIIISYSNSNIVYNAGIGFSSFNLWYEIDFDDPLPGTDPTINGFENMSKITGNNFLILPIGIQYYLGESSIYIPTNFSFNFSMNDVEQHKRSFYTIGSGIGIDWKMSDYFKISFEPTLKVFINSTPRTAPFRVGSLDGLTSLTDKEMLYAYGLSLIIKYDR